MNTTKKEEREVVETSSPIKKKKKVGAPTEYKVDIKGEVLTPGIYTLKKGSRVIDVIDASGGLTANADTSVLNLSRKITDEMVIIVYSKEEVANFDATKEREKARESSCIQKDENALRNDACISDNVDSLNSKVSINTATKEELMTLTGIGSSKAEDIIKYREENGPFENIEDIKKVSGIGDNLFDKIKENITT